MGRLWVIGLGPGEENLLPPANLEILRRVRPVFLRTAHHPLVNWLQNQGIDFYSFDRLYEEKPTLAAVYQGIVEALIEAAEDQAEACYAVPGHPRVAEDTVRHLLEVCRQRKIEVTILPAMSCLDAIFSAAGVDPADGLAIIEAGRLIGTELRPDLGLLVLQVYSRLVASEVKLTLLPLYGDEWEVILLRGVGVTGEERVEILPLYQIDRQPWVDHLTSLYVPPVDGKSHLGPPGSLATLVAVMARLRGPEGCPWDKSQTHASLRRYLLEEAHEVLEALDNHDMSQLTEELGDLLLQIVFHAQIAQEEGHFSILEVISSITEKLLRRHPHVFKGEHADTPEEVNAKWLKIKQQEKGQRDTLLGGIPNTLPALTRAQKMQERAATAGFDWPDIGGVWDKLREEEDELRQALLAGHRQQVVQELGDLLFTVVNMARFLRVDAEEALRDAVASFAGRFSFMEESCRREGRLLEELTLEELDGLWREAKMARYKNFPG